MKTIKILIAAFMIVSVFSCKQKTQQPPPSEDFKFFLEKFADLRVMRYRVPGFDSLTLDQKKLIYYLSQAALAGRDIIYDQNYKYNIAIRTTLEEIIRHYTGARESADFKNLMIYAKRVWFSNGIHHHYSTDKFFPEISKEYFASLVTNSEGALFPLLEGEKKEVFIQRMTTLIFDPTVAPKRVSQDASKDLVVNSACNFYEGVTEKEVVAYYESLKKPNDTTPISYGLNSKVIKRDDKVIEETYCTAGLYGAAIEKIVFWLQEALTVTENENQREALQKLIEYYTTGDLKTWDEYNISWVQDLNSQVDYVNGFVENYGDPMGMKATWESVVDFKDKEATKRTEIISANAQWFEDNSPVDPRFKKKEVKGVSAKVITVAQLGGDCYPSTPIGINLPNADWIRKKHGSKSVTMENITYAYDQVSLISGFLEEFGFSQEEIDREKKYGPLAGNINTDLHECLGHASGQLLPGTGTEALKNYHSPLEEARAELFALYYLIDPKLVELGILPSQEAAKAEYDAFMRNGLMTQLVRIEFGKTIEQAHMRSRQLIARWCYEKGANEKVIEKVTKDEKSYYKINDYDKLRNLFGELLKEVQRIKSEGDYEAGKALVENYGVQVDPILHKEVKERYDKLNLAPYGGFVNPVLKPVMKGDEIIDIQIEYPEDYSQQMLYYSDNYSFLPVYN
ncbi:MAG: dihydrofolate reductase [Bacteroidetes bacterium]|nr:dihydrofolate reductase [Bacteroidota bacterium]